VVFLLAPKEDGSFIDYWNHIIMLRKPFLSDSWLWNCHVDVDGMGIVQDFTDKGSCGCPDLYIGYDKQVGSDDLGVAMQCQRISEQIILFIGTVCLPRYIVVMVSYVVIYIARWMTPNENSESLLQDWYDIILSITTIIVDSYRYTRQLWHSAG
jgi:hypothetical protein